MPKRKDENPLIVLAGFLSGCPWWLGPILSAVVYCAVRWAAPALFASDDPKNLTARHFANIVAGIAPTAAMLLAGAIVLVWLTVEGQKLVDGKRLDSQTGIETVRRLDWRQFERLLSEAFRRQGYIVEQTGGYGPDGGFDQRLTRDGEQTLVQCKHWQGRKIGVSVVRELLGVVVAEQADTGIVVTSGEFTKEAIEFGEQSGIELIGGDELVGLIREAQRPRRAPSPPPIPTAEHAPTSRVCPVCNSTMVQRTARKGRNSGTQFWGCSRFPNCRGTREIT